MIKNTSLRTCHKVSNLVFKCPCSKVLNLYHSITKELTVNTIASNLASLNVLSSSELLPPDLQVYSKGRNCGKYTRKNKCTTINNNYQLLPPNEKRRRENTGKRVPNGLILLLIGRQSGTCFANQPQRSEEQNQNKREFHSTLDENHSGKANTNYYPRSVESGTINNNGKNLNCTSHLFCFKADSADSSVTP